MQRTSSRPPHLSGSSGAKRSTGLAIGGPMVHRSVQRPGWPSSILRHAAPESAQSESAAHAMVQKPPAGPPPRMGSLAVSLAQVSAPPQSASRAQDAPIDPPAPEVPLLAKTV